MPEFTKCPNCGLSEFSTRSARDNHVYKCKRKSTSLSDSLPNSSSQPERKPPEYFIRFDGRRVPLTEAELINEGIDWLKSKLTGKKPSPQVEEVKPPTVTELAEQRARELNGEIPPSQFESYTPSFDQQVQTQTAQISSRPTFNLSNAIRTTISKIFPQKKQPDFPENSYNEWSQPLFHHKCLSCGSWVSTNDVAIHQVDGHKVVYVG